MSAFSGKHFPILNIHLSRLQDLQKYTVVNDGKPPTIRELIFAALSAGLTLLEAGATPIPVPGGGRSATGGKFVHPLQDVVLSANVLDLPCVAAQGLRFQVLLFLQPPIFSINPRIFFDGFYLY
jgi:hypothetical protein